MLTWQQAAAGTTYSTPTWPLLVSLAGLVAVVLASLVAVTLVWRWERRGVLLAAPVLVLLGATTQLVLVLPGISWATAAEEVVEPWSAAGATLPWRVFGPLLLGELAVASLAGLVLAGAVAFTLSRRPSQGRWARLVPLWAALALTWLLAQVGAVHATWVVGLGRLPVLELDGPGLMHAGHTLEIHPRLDGAAHPERWYTPEIPPLEAPTPGTWPVELSTWRGPVAARATKSLRAGEERGDAALPLRVGNRWVWNVDRTTDDRALFGLVRNHSTSTSLYGSLEVVDTQQRGGLRTFRLKWESPGAPPTLMEVYALDGELWLLQEDGSAVRFIEHQGRVGSKVDACSFALLGSNTCECRPPAHSERPVSGPTWCAWTEGGRDARIGAGIAAVLSLGLVIPDASADVHLYLARSEQGPEGVPAVE